jgi:hypothetical protein
MTTNRPPRIPHPARGRPHESLTPPTRPLPAHPTQPGGNLARTVATDTHLAPGLTDWKRRPAKRAKTPK